MIETNDISIISNEVLTVLSNCGEEIIKKIPKRLIRELANCAADTEHTTILNPNKKLTQQDILEESKDLIALILYSYVADGNEKKKIEQIWDNNEKKYQEELQEKYNEENLFKKRKDNNNETVSLVEYKKENKFMQIINKILKKLGVKHDRN